MENRSCLRRLNNNAGRVWMAVDGRWYEEAGLIDVDVHYGSNGLEGRGTKASMKTAKLAATSRKRSMDSVMRIKKPI